MLRITKFENSLDRYMEHRSQLFEEPESPYAVLTERFKLAGLLAQRRGMSGEEVFSAAFSAAEQHIKDLGDAKQVARLLRSCAKSIVEQWS